MLDRERRPQPVVRMLSSDNEATRLVAKLLRGGFGPTAINDARNLRLNWEAHRRRWMTDLPVAVDHFDGVAAMVLNAAHTAENQTRGNGEVPYGIEMFRVLEAELGQRDLRLPGSEPADVRLLLGCAFDLTDECQIWWSDQFSFTSDEVAS